MKIISEKVKKKFKSYETFLELEWESVHTFVNILKATDLYTLEELALWYVYNISTNLLF